MKLLTKRQKRQALELVIGLVIILLGGIIHQKNTASSSQTPASADQSYYQVHSVIDGDTIEVTVSGKQEKVRLLGVDTPETKDPRKAVQCYGEAASQFTQALIGTNPVRLEPDPTNSDRDKYNRLLRYVYLPDGTLVNAEIIKQGYGFAYLTYPFQKADEFKTYEAQARKDNIGLWSSCVTTQDKNGTSKSTAIQ